MSVEEKHSIGVRLLRERRCEEASVILKEAFREAPTSTLANDWGVAESLRGHSVPAEQAFQQALKLDEDNASAAMNLGVLLASQRRYREAIPLLEKAAAGITGNDRATLLDMLKKCQVEYARMALRESKAAFRDVAKEQTENAASEAKAEPTDYWFPDITGWFSRGDALHLYTAIKLTRPRRILEIGTFYGRSTATICAAIRSLATPVEFITVDLDLRTEEEARKAFAEIHGVEVNVPKFYQEAFELGFSTTEYAEYRVRKHGLARYVKFACGDFRDLQGEFDFIFADAMHDAAEIHRNLPAVLRMLTSEGILAVHDLRGKNRETIEAMAGSIEFISSVETLGIFRVNAKTLRPRT
jgi:predicted O-methyltransferase YrrM